MNTETGRVYSHLSPEVQEALYSEYRARKFLAEHEHERLMTDEIEALEDVAAGQPVVPVSEQVVKKVRLGEKELSRRKNRRKAQRQARKRNR